MINDNESLDITAKTEELKNPRIRLVGSDANVGAMSDEEIILDIKARNDLSDEDIVKVAYKYKNKAKNTWNIIFEVNRPAYSSIMTNRKIFFDCNTCPVYNDFNFFFALNAANTGIKLRNAEIITSLFVLYALAIIRMLSVPVRIL